MTVDRKYCMSSYLMYRTICSHDRTFDRRLTPRFYAESPNRKSVHDSEELEAALRAEVERVCGEGRAALALSGGIDSAILARFMPKGSVAYTFKCVVPGIQVTDETGAAARYARECGLTHRVVEITWEDMEAFAPLLMKAKGAPIHSIEAQIYKASLQALDDGFDTLIFGESADANYGGLDGLLSRPWTIPQFLDRFSFLMPYRALKDFVLITEPVERHAVDGYVEAHDFIRQEFFIESMGSYQNAATAAGIRFEAPYGMTRMDVPLDYARVRAGENKYLVREVFHRLYPGWDVPKKTPMPRPTNEWLKDWRGPVRGEFWPRCAEGLTGDQKWQLWALERFLDMLDETDDPRQP